MKKNKPIKLVFNNPPAPFNSVEDLARAVRRLQRWANHTPNRRKPRKRRSPDMPWHLACLQYEPYRQVMT